MTMLKIDGSFGEGGGQILRSSVSLSAITGQPVAIEKIRAGRAKPGLQPQHLAAVRAAAALCDARLTGADIGSTRLQFTPQSAVAPGEYHFDIGTAGAAPLVLQTVLLPLALASKPSRVTVTGGTHVPHAPTFDYLEQVYLASLRRQGLAATVSAPSAGFYPRGGGVIQAEIPPFSRLSPLAMTERGALKTLTARVVTSGLPLSVSERGVAALRQELQSLPEQLTADLQDVRSPGTGAAITLIAETEHGLAGFSALGERGKPMEQVAYEACAAFWDWWKTGAACDAHLADQWVLPMALTPGTSRWTTAQVTEHLKTMLWLLPQFLPVTISLDAQPNGVGTVTLVSANHSKSVSNY